MSFARGRMAALASIAVGIAAMGSAGIPESAYKPSSPEVCNRIRKNSKKTGAAKIKRTAKKNKRRR